MYTSLSVFMYWTLFKTRKSSCVNARGIPPAVYWVLLLLSYLDTPPPSWPGGVPCRGGVPDQGTPPRAGYPPPSWPGRGRGTQVRVIDTFCWLSTRRKVWCCHSIIFPLYPAPPPLGDCPMAFWEMLQSIMGYGYPPPVTAPWHSGKCCKALWDMGTPPPPWTDRLMDGRTNTCQNITFPSYYVRGQ